MTQAENKSKILVITGTRAEYGLLYPVMRVLQEHPAFKLQILATCMHLSDTHGQTINEIRQDRFHVDDEVDMEISGDRDIDIARSMGLGLTRMADVMDKSRPDAVLLLGDRFEILAAASAAAAMRIPIIHLEGGHVTYGAMDDAFRHAITKLAHLHFTACDTYRQRIIQLGEQAENVHVVGSTGLDNFLKEPRLSAEELSSDLDFPLGPSAAAPLLLVTFHPATLELGLSEAEQTDELLDALQDFPHARILITAPNADTGSHVIHKKLEAFAADAPKTRKFVTSLGRRRYSSVLALTDCVVGNSSSGLIEAPSFGIGTVNIGSRQDGRIRAQSVLDCPVNRDQISASIKKALSPAFREKARTVKNPFGDGTAAEKIVAILADTDFASLRRKTFQDLDCTPRS